ncbi:hypothetical protein JCM6882_009397 [Rhodosporidiobolus microsporus]
MASLVSLSSTSEATDVRPPSLALNSLKGRVEHLNPLSSNGTTAYDPTQAVHRTPGHARHLAPTSSLDLSHDLHALSFPPHASQHDYYHDLSTPPRTPSPTHSRNSLFFSHEQHPIHHQGSLDLSPPTPTRQGFGAHQRYGGGGGDGYSCPVSALEGRSTPFFMALPDEVEDDDGEASPPRQANGVSGMQTLPYTSEERAPVLVSPAPLRAGARSEVQPMNGIRASENGGDELAMEQRDSRRDSGYGEKANAAHLFGTVHSLASRVVDLTNLTDSLYTRLSFLEETAYTRDREVDTLRSLVFEQHQVQPQQQLPPPPQAQHRPFVPPPLPYDLQDYPDESTLDDPDGGGGDLTPPASSSAAPLLRHPHPHHYFHPASLSFSPSPYDAASGFGGGGGGSRSSTPRSPYPPAPMRGWSSSLPPSAAAREGPFSAPYGQVHFQQQQGMPPAFQSYHPQQLPQQQQQQRPLLPRLNLNLDGSSSSLPSSRRSSMIAEQALRQAMEGRMMQSASGSGNGHVGPRMSSLGIARERSVSVSGAGSTASSSSGSGARSVPMHARAVSLGSALPPRSARASGVNGIVEQLNYRLLLENDSDIDSEAFVRRILVHNDQQCSLFLQQRVRTTTDERRRHLFSAVANNVLELSQSKFGNFLVSRCLEAGDLKLAQQFEQSFAGRFLQLALDPFGCHVVQKLLDCGDSATKARIIEELMPHPSTLTQKNAGHVWNRILTTSNPPPFYRRLAEMGTGTWADVVQDDGGSLIVQHVLEDWAEAHTSVVAREVLEKVGEVAKSACGSFVLAHLIDRNALPFCSKIMQLAPELVADNFGARIVERCVRSGRVPTTTLTGFVDALTESDGSNPPLLIQAASHTNGTSLLSSLLSGPPTSTISHRDKDKLARCVAAHATVLVQDAGQGGGRLVALCQQRGVKV